MSRKWIAAVASLAMVISTSAFAQGDAAGAAPPSTYGQAVTPNAPMPPPDTNNSGSPSPNAPVQSSDEGPVAPGDVAGTPAAASWTPSVAEIAVAGAVAVGAAICIAACGGSGNNTTTTTKTTSPK